MNTIDKLIGRMTLAEKLGQMTMTSASYAVTGPVIAGDSTESIRNGTLGNLLNLVGAKHVHEMQRIAVEESRLKIPLMIGFDVIHGHRTIFPVPLAEASTFDPQIWEANRPDARRRGKRTQSLDDRDRWRGVAHRSRAFGRDPKRRLPTVAAARHAQSARSDERARRVSGCDGRERDGGRRGPQDPGWREVRAV